MGDRWPESLDEHAAIIRAIEDRDEELARRLAREHMETAKKIRLRLLKETAIHSF